jgi:thiamine biosynthesis protein ThiS
VSDEQIIVIFAKRPIAGKVKTRLTQTESSHLGALSKDQSARIYQAFLDDYGKRFHSDLSPARAVFCLPDRPESHDPKLLCQNQLPILIEPKHQGRAANSIGQAMSFTLRHFFAKGQRKVVILGSDLPHLPFSFIETALKLLDQHPLVLGNDGGGCYLVAASEVATVLESEDIVWSQGRDFDQIIQQQKTLGKGVAVIPEVIQDIDDAKALDALIDQLNNDPQLSKIIPATTKALRNLGAPISGRASMKIIVNGESMETRQNKLGELLAQLEIKRQGCAVEINEEIVPRNQIDQQAIAEGDCIEIVRLVGGG